MLEEYWEEGWDVGGGGGGGGGATINPPERQKLQCQNYWQWVEHWKSKLYPD